jgi:peptide/nickel transport system substrate-binding protein
MPLHVRPLLVAALTAALATTSACSLNREETQPANTLRIAGPFEIHSLKPVENGYFFTRLQVTETLVTSDIDGQLAPGLATEWSSSPDGTRWVLELAEDATFHDGTPVTPEAVISSLDKAVTESASPLTEVPIRRFGANESSVVVDLERPYPSLPAMLTHYSAAILAPASYDEKEQVSKIIGSGPYEIENIELPAAITTTRFDDWRGATPEVENVSFQAVGRAESRALMAASDQADVVFGLEPAGTQRVEAADGVAMESSLQPRTILMKVNAAHPVLGDVRVRRAISMALDREAMAEAVLRERELAATQLFPPSLSTWHTDVAPLHHDMQAARDLLAAAGWSPGNDGVLRKDGEPLQLTLLTYPDRPELPALATAAQAALAKVGVDVKVDVTNSSEVPARHAEGTLELALVAKHFALVSDPLVDVADVFAAQGSDWGVMNWRDPDVERALTRLTAGADRSVAARQRETIARTAQQELPLIPVAWYRMNAAVDERVQGFVMDPLETNWRITEMRLAP